MPIRKTTQQEKEVFQYLNELRESGVTNMYGATPYIVNEFEINIDEARKYLSTWMKVFNKEGAYEEVDAT